jgi:3-deoxy-D-manno-octulosonic-acid transferase
VTAPLALYRQAMRVFHGFAPGVLKSRIAEGKEDAARWRERLGLSDMARPDGRLVWFHGVSVGESLSALPVIEALRARRPDLQALITSATTTSAEILSQRLTAGVIHQFAPIDTPQAVAGFLDHWHPDLALFIESDIWPTLLGELDARRIPRALLSARITEKTAQGWRRFRASMSSLLEGFQLISAQDGASETRLKAMGPQVAARVQARANLKTLGAAPPVDAAKVRALKAMIGGRFVWLAASTHPGEDDLIAQTLEPGLLGGDLLILAPRHPVRAEDIRASVAAMGLRAARRSLNEAIDDRTQVYLADTLGELGTLFTLSDIIIMGGSFFEDVGGHNPLEPARLGKSVITGPDIANWRGVYTDLQQDGAALTTTALALPAAVRRLRHHPDEVYAMDRRALAFSQREDSALDTVMALLTPLLPDPKP